MVVLPIFLFAVVTACDDGLKAALEMIVSGRHVPAEEAHRLGIVDELAPEGQLKAAAIAFARWAASSGSKGDVRGAR